MSERTDSQIIHEAKGLCWHEWVWYPIEKNTLGNRKCYCRNCDEQNMGISINAHVQKFPSNPDYTDPTSYLEAMAWARVESWWTEFLVSIGIDGQDYQLLMCDIEVFVEEVIDILLDPKLGSHALAEFLEGRMSEEGEILLKPGEIADIIKRRRIYKKWAIKYRKPSPKFIVIDKLAKPNRRTP